MITVQNGGAEMTIHDGFMAFAEKYNLPLQEKNENGSSIFSFRISGEKGKYNAFAMCMEEERMLVFFFFLNIKIKKKNKETISRYLMGLNYQLKQGAFQIEPDTGDVMVRTCQYIFGSQAEQEALIERIVLLSGMIADNYRNDIIKQM